MIKRIINFLYDLRDRQRISIALSKGGAMMHGRNIDLTQPWTWEFSGFSQNGEDGILDVLRKNLTSRNHYFIEIGAADGIENNTGWLLIAEKYNGLMIEGNAKLVERGCQIMAKHSIASEFLNMFVTKESVLEIMKKATHLDPDVFSLDIDGNDYFIAQSIFDAGFRPKIFVVEYNSVYGAERSMTIEYQADFSFKNTHPTQLYYGVSISGWKNFFKKQGYQFVTVDRHGVNGFFVDPTFFSETFLDEVKGLAFADNQYQCTKFKMSNEEQFSLISEQKFVNI